MTTPEFPEPLDSVDNNDRWDALAAQITASAKACGSGLYWVGTARVGWFEAGVLIAAGIITSLSSPTVPASASSSVQLTGILTPADSVEQAILSANQPPAIATLLLAVAASDGKK